jgi:excisionase family DNA binding protein
MPHTACVATQNTPLTTTRLVPAKRAARELGVPYSTIRDSVHRGELAVIRLGRSVRHAAWYFERRDLDSWIAHRKGAA